MDIQTKPKKSLNHRQRTFLHEYVYGSNRGNATQCAIKAGFKPSAAANYGRELLQKTRIKEALEAEYKKADLTQDEIRAGILSIAHNGKVEANRLRAFELLGKDKGMFKETTVGQGVAIFSDAINEVKAISTSPSAVSLHNANYRNNESQIVEAKDVADVHKPVDNEVMDGKHAYSQDEAGSPPSTPVDSYKPSPESSANFPNETPSLESSSASDVPPGSPETGLGSSRIDERGEMVDE